MTLSRPKAIGFWVVTIGVVFLLVNVVALVGIWAILGVSFYDARAYASQKRTFRIDTTSIAIPHPYYGRQVVSDERFTGSLSEEPMFYATDAPSQSSDREIRVLVLGGSVAAHLSRRPNHTENILGNLLKERFKSDRFSVYNAALAGGKQPQQYLKLVYLDLQGFKPDIIINYDGFNEIALPISENPQVENPLVFPRFYSRFVEGSVASRRCVGLTNAILDVDTRFPVFDALGWTAVMYCNRALSGPKAAPWWSRFYRDVDQNQDQQAARSAMIWSESSNRIYQFASSRSIDYIHVLQPNQYYPDSKPFSEEEKASAFGFSLYGDPVAKYYGYLKAADVKTPLFRDQRLLFKDVGDTLYNDTCCHFNAEGMTRIVEDIIQQFRGVFEKALARD